jgi:cytochrome c oxidase subunit 2
MYAPVVVVEPADFEAWLGGQEVKRPVSGEVSPVEQGERIASEGCLSCHSTDGSQKVGPTWLGLFGSERQLEDGSTVLADEAYLRTSIVDPGAQIVTGYSPIMPDAYDFLTKEEVNAVIEYIKSLEP